jgi:hypothetical protein
VSEGLFVQVESRTRPKFLTLNDNDLEYLTGKTSDMIQNLENEEKEEIKNELSKDWRKIGGELYSNEMTSNNFALHVDAMKYIVAHFNKTKNVEYLHNFFKNHEYYNIDSLLGRYTHLEVREVNADKQILEYEAILSNKHPIVQRAELFKCVSGTFIRGAIECSECGQPYKDSWEMEPSCDHIPNNTTIKPVTRKAINFEISYVTLPRYPNASAEILENAAPLLRNSEFREHITEEFPDVIDYNKIMNASSNDDKLKMLEYFHGTEMLNDQDTDTETTTDSDSDPVENMKDQQNGEENNTPIIYIVDKLENMISLLSESLNSRVLLDVIAEDY